jgi:hypothetical protein
MRVKPPCFAGGFTAQVITLTFYFEYIALTKRDSYKRRFITNFLQNIYRVLTSYSYPKAS